MLYPLRPTNKPLRQYLPNMFRRKQKASAAATQVTDLDDDAPNPLTSTPSRPTYTLTNDALELNYRTPHPTSDELNQMDSTQLQELVEQSAQAGKDATAHALRMATEARQIGADTAQTMQNQTEQLEKMTEDLVDVNASLDKSERTIDKMNRPKIVRMFQIKRSKGKGLDKVRPGEKELEERQKIRNEGLDSIDVRAMQKQEATVDMDDLEAPVDSLDGEGDSNKKNRLKLFGGKRTKSNEAANTPLQSSRRIQEDYSGYSDNVATVLRKQDDDLDKISDVLGDMKSMANAMNNELEYQAQVINDVQNMSEETSKRTRDNKNRIARYQ